MNRIFRTAVVVVLVILLAVSAGAVEAPTNPILAVPVSIATIPEAPAPAEPTALMSAVNGLFGTYTPKTQTVTTYLPDGSSVESQEYVPGVAGMDIPWLVGVLLFVTALYCLLKMIGGVLKRG